MRDAPRARERSIAFAATLLILARPLLAGDGRIPVSPCPGSVQCTGAGGGYPFTISTRGSYYLTDDLGGTGVTVFVQIDSDNVTVDLAGHAIGTTDATGSLITATGRSNLRITNGKLFGGAYGIALYALAGGPSPFVQVDNVNLQGQEVDAILMSGDTAGTPPNPPIVGVVERCSIEGAAKADVGVHLKAAVDSRVEFNTSRGCKGNPGSSIFIDGSQKVLVSHNEASGSYNGVDIAGLVTQGSDNNLVTDNVASGNFIGIHVQGANNMVSGNMASQNFDAVGSCPAAGRGIVVDGGGGKNTILQNTVSGNKCYGIHVTAASNNSGNTIELNFASGNSFSSGTGCGIRIESSATGNCLLNNRTMQGAFAETGCTNGRNIPGGQSCNPPSNQQGGNFP